MPPLAVFIKFYAMRFSVVNVLFTVKLLLHKRWKGPKKSKELQVFNPGK